MFDFPSMLGPSGWHRLQAVDRRPHRWLFCGVCLLASLGTSSCWFRRSPRAFNPPPVAARPAPVLPPAPPLLVPQESSTPVLASLPPAPLVALDLPPPPAPPKPRVASAPKSAAQTQPQEPVEPAKALRLGQIFTQEQQREYNRTIDESLERVRQNLEKIAAKRLTADQSREAESIRTFQRQAEQAREQDLLTAVNLARRADLLAKDLLQRLP
jgi:hypothetical protein